MRKRLSRPAERTSGVRAEKLQALTELTRRLTSMPASVPLFAEVARAAAALLAAGAARVWIDAPRLRYDIFIRGKPRPQRRAGRRGNVLWRTGIRRLI